MSNQDVLALSSSTGTFRTVQLKAEQVPEAGKAQPEAGKEQPVPAREKPDLEALAVQLNAASKSIGRDLRFRVDMNSGHSVIQVLDSDTGEIIREIPPEKASISLSGAGDMQLRLYDALA